MTSCMRKENLAEVRFIHAEQMSLYNLIILRKEQWTHMKIKQLKQDILNQYESIGFPKLLYLSNQLWRNQHSDVTQSWNWN